MTRLDLFTCLNSVLYPGTNTHFTFANLLSIMSRKRKSPLEIPEIRQRVSLFLSTKDSITCARVCRAWRDDFISAIWRTVDDGSCVKMSHLNPRNLETILTKHGHHIRVVQIKRAPDLGEKLQNASISRVRCLSISVLANSRVMAHCSDIIHRNINTLTSISLSLPPAVATDLLLFNVDALSPHAHTGTTSKLTSLKLHGLRMTRNSFSRLLRICPYLDSLDLSDTVIESNIITDRHQHERLDRLTASIEQVFLPDPDPKKAPSLLEHFPNITQWETWQTTKMIRINSDAIFTEVSHCCRRIRHIRARAGVLPLANMVVYGLRNLSEVTFLSSQLSPQLIMAMLTHKDTLKTVTTSVSNHGIFQSTQVPPVEYNFAEFSWNIHFIPSQCLRLKTFSLPSHEVNMNDIEKLRWTCEDLEVLQIRIKDLNTKELIERALELWTDGRQANSMKDVKGAKNARLTWQSALLSADDRYHPTSIEVRVARHLLRFKKLRYVWLGTKTWRA